MASNKFFLSCKSIIKHSGVQKVVIYNYVLLYLVLIVLRISGPCRLYTDGISSVRKSFTLDLNVNIEYYISKLVCILCVWHTKEIERKER